MFDAFASIARRTRPMARMQAAAQLFRDRLLRRRQDGQDRAARPAAVLHRRRRRPVAGAHRRRGRRCSAQPSTRSRCVPGPGVGGSPARCWTTPSRELPADVLTLDAWTRENTEANAWYQRSGFAENHRYLHVTRHGTNLTTVMNPRRDSHVRSWRSRRADIEHEAAMRERHQGCMCAGSTCGRSKGAGIQQIAQGAREEKRKTQSDEGADAQHGDFHLLASSMPLP